MHPKPPTIDAEFVRYPRALDGRPAPAPFDPEEAVNDFVTANMERLVSEAIMRDFYEKQCQAFNLGNRR